MEPNLLFENGGANAGFARIANSRAAVRPIAPAFSSIPSTTPIFGRLVPGSNANFRSRRKSGRTAAPPARQWQPEPLVAKPPPDAGRGTPPDWPRGRHAILNSSLTAN